MCMSLIPAVSRDLGHPKLLKHSQNPYSIERVDHKLSKTPSHALIDAVGGSQHRFECTMRALSVPNRARRGKVGPQGLIRGGVGERRNNILRSLIPSPTP